MSYRASWRVSTDMKGRHFGFLGILCATWVSTRVVILSFGTSGQLPLPLLPSLKAMAKTSRLPDALTASKGLLKIAICCEVQMKSERRAKPAPRFHWAQMTSQKPMAFQAAIAPAPYISSVNSVTLSPFPIEPNVAAPKTGRFGFYAYSFWRQGTGPAPLGVSQYGGGQSGIITTYHIGRRLSLLARATIAHENIREREIAAGMRWLPNAKVPISMTIERRFRNSEADVFAAYAAGGKSGVTLPLQMKLEAFGQAGVISGRGGGYFFDTQARAEREILGLGRFPVTAGGGIWAGGQKGVSRIDIGPTIGTKIKIGEGSFRLNADWRFRVAGNARPGNGPAVTLSTSF